MLQMGAWKTVILLPVAFVNYGVSLSVAAFRLKRSPRLPSGNQPRFNHSIDSEDD
jgi:hypothetical protein